MKEWTEDGRVKMVQNSKEISDLNKTINTIEAAFDSKFLNDTTQSAPSSSPQGKWEDALDTLKYRIAVREFWMSFVSPTNSGGAGK